MLRQTRAIAFMCVVLAACEHDDPSFVDAAPEADAPGTDGAAADTDAAPSADADIVPIAPDGIAGLEMWLDGSRGVAATTWADQSGHGRGVTCTVGGFTAGTLNGHPAAHATGSNCKLAANVPVFQPDEGVLVAVAASITSGGGLVAIDAASGNNNNIELSAGNNVFGMIGGVTVYATGQYAGGVPHVFLVYRRNNVVSIRADGVAGQSVTEPFPTVTGGYVMWAPFTFTVGDIGDVLVYRGDVSAAQLAGLEAYLLAKYRP